MNFFTKACTNFYAFILAVFLTLASYYFQYGMGLEPCPLCILQRFIVMVLAVWFLFGIFFKTKVLIKSHCVITIILASFGALAALRKIWLQYFPSSGDNLTCGPDVGYLLRELPLTQILKVLFYSEGTCANIDWQFLTLSMSAWTLLFFILFIALAAVNFFRLES
ncbi:MAG: disulfide bond formation protein B [Gammaproteobacteria bacterium]